MGFKLIQNRAYTHKTRGRYRSIVYYVTAGTETMKGVNHSDYVRQWSLQWLQPGKNRGGGGTKGMSGTTPLGPRPFPCLKHFLPEETPPVSQKISFECDDLDKVHTPLPKFSHQVWKNLKNQLSAKVGRLRHCLPLL